MIGNMKRIQRNDHANSNYRRSTWHSVFYACILRFMEGDVMKIKVAQIGEVTLEGEEIERLWELLKNECERAEVVESTTYGMYQKLKRWFEPWK